jgi:membrane protease YdiL (CAAX protease family)
MTETDQVCNVMLETIKPWPLWTSVGIVAAGFVVLNITVVAMINFDINAYQAFHLSRVEANAVSIIVASAASMIVGYLLARKFVVSGPREFFRSIAWRPTPLQIIFVTLLGVFMTLVIRSINTGHLGSLGIGNTHLTPLFALILLGTVLMQPFAEELYFRGILFSGLSSKLSPFLSICIVTFVFVLGHAQHRWIVLPISIVLGIVRLLTKSTANCFFLHAAYNLGVVLWGIR